MICLVLFFLLGGPLCLRSLGDTAVLPGASTLGRVADQAVFGWKDLLTTLPPIDGDGPLLVLPWMVGDDRRAGRPRAWPTCPCGAPGSPRSCPSSADRRALRRHRARRAPPRSRCCSRARCSPAWRWRWLAVRARRASATVQGGSTSYVRGAGAVVMLALAAALAFPASALVARRRRRAGGGAQLGRAAVRHRPVPLAAGRVPPLHRPPGPTRRDQRLRQDAVRHRRRRARHPRPVRGDGPLRRHGLGRHRRRPARDRPTTPSSGCPATIDNPVDGKEVDVTVTLGEGYDGVWLPTVGALQSMTFETGDAARQGGGRSATTSPRRPRSCRAGSSRATATPSPPIEPDDELTDETVGSVGRRPASPPGAAFIQGPTEKWTESAGDDPMDRVLAAAEHLQDRGQVLRRHRPHRADLRRRAQRLAALRRVRQRPADRRQRRAVRRHDGAASPTTSASRPASCSAPWCPRAARVTGKDVSAWVELRAGRRLVEDAAHRARSCPRRRRRTRSPRPTPRCPGTVIPPPNPIPPPSDAGEQSDADLKERKATRKNADEDEESLIAGLPGWVGAVVTYVGGPLLLIALLLGRRRGAQGAASPPSAERRVGLGPRSSVPGASWSTTPATSARSSRSAPTVTRREQSVGIVSGERRRRSPAAPTASSSARASPRPPPRRPTGTRSTPSVGRCRERSAVGSGCRAAISLRSLLGSPGPGRRRGAAPVATREGSPAEQRGAGGRPARLRRRR